MSGATWPTFKRANSPRTSEPNAHNQANPAHDNPPLWDYGYIIQRFIVAHINVRDCVWIYREKEGRKERERDRDRERERQKQRERERQRESQRQRQRQRDRLRLRQRERERERISNDIQVNVHIHVPCGFFVFESQHVEEANTACLYEVSACHDHSPQVMLAAHVEISEF